MRPHLSIHSDHRLDDYFYSASLKNWMDSLYLFLGDRHQIHLFPEATVKTNKVPNGVLIKSQSDESLFMPAILRDPGCGFLLFKIMNVPKSKLAELAVSLLAFCKGLEQSRPGEQENLKHAMQYGISHIMTHPFFADSVFPVDINHLYLDLSLDELAKDLSNITNTLELRLMDKDWMACSDRVDLLGFIHTGSEYLPKLILNTWLPDAVDFTCANKLTSIEQIHQGFYGLKNNTEEGHEYKQAIYAAMNYCLFKRWWLFSQIESFLESSYSLETQCLHDKCHAGLFKISEQGSEYDIQTRGVQIVNKNDTKPYLIAGQKESVAYLLQGIEEAYIGHGTSYAVNAEMDYQQAIPDQLKFDLHHLVSNVAVNPDNSGAYNYNILQQLQYIATEKSVCTSLYPLFNYHGKYTRDLSKCEF